MKANTYTKCTVVHRAMVVFHPKINTKNKTLLRVDETLVQEFITTRPGKAQKFWEIKINKIVTQNTVHVLSSLGWSYLFYSLQQVIIITSVSWSSGPKVFRKHTDIWGNFSCRVFIYLDFSRHCTCVCDDKKDENDYNSGKKKAFL